MPYGSIEPLDLDRRLGLEVDVGGLAGDLVGAGGKGGVLGGGGGLLPAKRGGRRKGDELEGRARRRASKRGRARLTVPEIIFLSVLTSWTAPSSASVGTREW